MNDGYINILDASHADRILQQQDNVAAIQDFIESLEKHQCHCEEVGRYEEANLARERLEQLKDHEVNRRREECRSMQLAERLAIEEAHMTEIQEFNRIWDEKVQQFEQHAQFLQQTLAGRQQQELAACLENHKNDLATRGFKASKQLLNLRHIEKSLAKQRKYEEAASTKATADALEAQEAEAWQRKAQEAMVGKEECIAGKQEREMKGLLKRIESGRVEQGQARKQELQRLLQRYHNVKTQLETQQNIQRLRQERVAAAQNSRSQGSPFK